MNFIITAFVQYLIIVIVLTVSYTNSQFHSTLSTLVMKTRHDVYTLLHQIICYMYKYVPNFPNLCERITMYLFNLRCFKIGTTYLCHMIFSCVKNRLSSLLLETVIGYEYNFCLTLL